MIYDVHEPKKEQSTWQDWIVLSSVLYLTGAILYGSLWLILYSLSRTLPIVWYAWQLHLALASVTVIVVLLTLFEERRRCRFFSRIVRNGCLWIAFFGIAEMLIWTLSYPGRLKATAMQQQNSPALEGPEEKEQGQMSVGTNLAKTVRVGRFIFDGTRRTHDAHERRTN